MYQLLQIHNIKNQIFEHNTPKSNYLTLYMIYITIYMYNYTARKIINTFFIIFLFVCIFYFTLDSRISSKF